MSSGAWNTWVTPDGTGVAVSHVAIDREQACDPPVNRDGTHWESRWVGGRQLATPVSIRNLQDGLWSRFRHVTPLGPGLESTVGAGQRRIVPASAMSRRHVTEQ